MSSTNSFNVRRFRAPAIPTLFSCWDSWDTRDKTAPSLAVAGFELSQEIGTLAFLAGTPWDTLSNHSRAVVMFACPAETWDSGQNTYLCAVCGIPSTARAAAVSGQTGGCHGNSV
jgi:hypothetical protein